MITKAKEKTQIKVITGNAAAATAAKLARPEVVAAYPITPQTEIIEQISKFHNCFDVVHGSTEGTGCQQFFVDC